MYLDLLKHHWKYHRSIILVFTIFLSLFLILLDAQSFIAQGTYYVSYQDYFSKNKVDWMETGAFSKFNMAPSQYDNEVSFAQTYSDISQFALVLYNNRPLTNLTISQGNNTYVRQMDIVIGSVSSDGFSALKNLGLVNSSSNLGNESLISISFAQELGINPITMGKNPVNISVKDAFSNKTHSFSLTNNFTNIGLAEQNAYSYASSFSVDIFLPLKEFVTYFTAQPVSYTIFIEQNRQLLYTPLTIDQNIAKASDFSYRFTETTSATYYADYYSTLYYLQNAKNAITTNLVGLIVVSSPSLLISLLFGSLLVQLWNKEFFEAWLYFKPRGLKFTTYQRSYIILAGLLAIIASLISALFVDITVTSLLSVAFNQYNLPWFSTVTQNMWLNIPAALLIAFWSFLYGLRKLKDLNFKEVQHKQYENQNHYAWAPYVFVIGIISIIIPYLLLAGTIYLPSLSISVNFWLTIVVGALVVFAPFGLFLGVAGMTMRYLPVIEEKILTLIAKYRFKRLTSFKFSQTTRIGLFFILIFSLQLFLFLGSYNTNYISQQRSNLQLGADYATAYPSIAYNINITDMQLFQNTVMKQIPEIKESWLTTKIAETGYIQNADAVVEVYRYNATTIPARYTIPDTTRILLKQAFDQQKGILLNTGKIINQKNLTIVFFDAQVLNVSVVSPMITMPGFPPDISPYAQLSIFPLRPAIVQLFLPMSINISSYNLTELPKVQFFTGTGYSYDIQNKILAIAQAMQNQVGYISLENTVSSVEYTTNSFLLTDNTVLVTEIILFISYALICFIIYSQTELNKQKEEFGIYLSKGVSFSLLRKTFLWERVLLVTVTSISALLIAIFATFCFLQLVFLSTTLIFPLVPINIILIYFMTLFMYVVLDYFVITYTIKAKPIISYRPKVT